MSDINTIKKEIEETKQRIKGAQELLESPENQELFVLAQEELKNLEEKEKNLQETLEDLLSKPASPSQGRPTKEAGRPRAAIIEIRAGAGGEEAALFAQELFKMYSKYAQRKGWKQKVLNFHQTDLNGLKEIIFELDDGDIWSQIKYEGGVHRIQRIPETEKSGRIHTSTASVAVLPKPKKAQIKINPKDLKIDVYKASGPGGQYVNKRETAVRITHLPTGFVVTSQTARNQLDNKENALMVLKAKLLKKKEEEEIERIGGKRKNQIGRAKRAEKIRTYNFPQDRVTDHRVKKSWHDIEGIMAGKLDPIIKTLKKKLQD